MSGPWIKVCGITRAEDALAAVASGAHAVGLILAESPRRVTVETAAAIARALPEGVARVGVTVNAAPGDVRAWVERIGLDAVQAHGEESAETCAAYGCPVVKALPAPPGFDPSVLEPYREFSVLLDGAAAGARGGTGRTADWEGARRAREAGFRVLLAGGLGPDNVAEAVRRVRPLGVDLNSGVETAPGIKSPEAIAAAVRAIRASAQWENTTWPW